MASGSVAGAEMMTFFTVPANVFARVGALGKKAGGFDNDLCAHRSPIEFGGILHAENFEGFAVYGNRIVRVRDLVRKIAENRIVFQQVRQRLGIRDVVDGHNLDGRVAERGAKNIAADAAKPVDTDFDGHASS